MITIRAVTMDDAETLLSWRNDPDTRAASLSIDEVERPAHLAWLTRTLGDLGRTLYLGSLDGVAVGTVRFDRDETDATTAEVSITVAPEQRGRRLALPLLRAGITAYTAEGGHDREIVARIREENTISRALFAAAGFHEVDCIDGVLLLSAASPEGYVSAERPS